MKDQKPDLYALIVGDRAHRIAAALAGQNLEQDRSIRAIALTDTAQAIFAKYPVEYRPRESIFQAVTAAGVYLNRFRPEKPWKLLGTEIASGGCRFDLAFQSRQGILIDELKLGVGRIHEAQIRAQIDRYLVEGRYLWGGEFLGVRLCFVNEPASSRFYSPKSKRSNLVNLSELADILEIR